MTIGKFIGCLESVLPFVLIANIPAGLFGLVCLGLANDAGYWGADIYPAIALVSFWPASFLVGLLCGLTKSEPVERFMLQTLSFWGILMVALAAIWILTIAVAQ